LPCTPVCFFDDIEALVRAQLTKETSRITKKLSSGKFHDFKFSLLFTLFHCVFDITRHVMRGAFDLVELALRLQLFVVCDLARRVLNSALCFFGSAFDVFAVHPELSFVIALKGKRTPPLEVRFFVKQDSRDLSRRNKFRTELKNILQGTAMDFSFGGNSV